MRRLALIALVTVACSVKYTYHSTTKQTLVAAGQTLPTEAVEIAPRTSA